MKLTVQIIVLI